MNAAQRKVELDIEAIALSAISILIWMSLLSHDPADSLGELPRPLNLLVAVDNAVYPPNAQIQNVCGWFGALVANLLIQSLGIGSLLVAIGLSVLSIWLFKVQTNYVPPSRQIGWFLVIVGTTTLVALYQIATPFAPIIGPGGYIGAITSTWLHENFAVLGASILTFSILLAGLLLSTDYVVVRSMAWLLAGGTALATTVARSRITLPIGTPLVSKTRSDVDQGIELPGDAVSSGALPPVRISGRTNSDLSSNDMSAVRSAASGALASGQKLASAANSAAKGLLTGWMTGSSPSDTSSNYPQLAVEPSAVSSAEETSEIEQTDAIDEEADEVDQITEPLRVELTTTSGETLNLRVDAAHPTPEPDALEPQVSPPKSRKGKNEDHAASLAGMDDTKLPPGADEYILPEIELLSPSEDVDFEAQTVEVRRKAKILEATFKNFGFNVRVVEIETGPVIAQYEIELEAGLRLAKITSLADDLAIALRVPSVRIVAPIPGKNTVGIEVPNETRQVVRLREVIEEMGPKGRKAKIPLFLGKDVSGNPLIADLATLPHLLIAGRTGTGKSVCLNAIIASILMTRRPDEVRMLMIDPKMVEMIGYGRLPHLMHPVVTDMRKAEAILAWAVDKMEERYSLLARAGVRHLTSYNELDRAELLDRIKPETSEEADAIPDHLPFIVIVADEMADLMMTAGKDVEQHIIRLAQKSRAVGIHLILATQKPTVDVITGLIKSNLPARISFQVASRTDSRVVLDEMGADKLLGNGDMLFLWPGTSMLLRGQGTYLSDEEINRVVDHCSTGEQNFVSELVNLKIKEETDEEPQPMVLKKRDELYAAAVDVVVREGRGSCSLLQRALGIGYGRAARLIDYMAEDGIVGQYAGSQARDVIISLSDWEAMQAADSGSSGARAPKPPASARSNKIRPQEPSLTPPSDSSATAGSVNRCEQTPSRPAIRLAVKDDAEADEFEATDDAPWEDPATGQLADDDQAEDGDDGYEYEDVDDED
ncbi:MAG: DNA translocase FtsK [Pirellulaceae bacterium]|nr:DNA translocase FtsK [Pirellulaceae bacterium]